MYVTKIINKDRGDIVFCVWEPEQRRLLSRATWIAQLRNEFKLQRNNFSALFFYFLFAIFSAVLFLAFNYDFSLIKFFFNGLCAVQTCVLGPKELLAIPALFASVLMTVNIRAGNTRCGVK